MSNPSTHSLKVEPSVQQPSSQEVSESPLALLAATCSRITTAAPTTHARGTRPSLPGTAHHHRALQVVPAHQVEEATLHPRLPSQGHYGIAASANLMAGQQLIHGSSTDVSIAALNSCPSQHRQTQQVVVAPELCGRGGKGGGEVLQMSQAMQAAVVFIAVVLLAMCYFVM